MAAIADVDRTLVLFPINLSGHLIPMVELAKLFQSHGYRVIIPIIEIPAESQSIASSAVARVSAANPSVSFHGITISGAPNPALTVPANMFETIRYAGPSLAAFLRSLPGRLALIVDFICIPALDVAAELGIPAYVYFTSPPYSLALCLRPAFLDMELDETSDEPLGLAGAPWARFADLGQFAAERGNEAFKARYRQMSKIRDSDGILINTFTHLNAESLAAIADGLQMPDQRMPPIYPVGPVLATGDEKDKEGEERHACLRWLDGQPERTVVFISFGSMGRLLAQQLTELAIGLERSGHRFLWVVRAPKSDSQRSPFEAVPEPDLDAILPAGFLERTEGRGFVVKSWVPQVAVLKHPAIGAFLTHCGWNSTLEAIAAGVPMLCWPMFAEQHMNCAFLTREFRVAAEVEGVSKGVVPAEEIEAKVRLVMESEEGRGMRERVAAAKEAAAAAWEEGGSSQVAFTAFLRDLEQKWKQ